MNKQFLIEIDCCNVEKHRIIIDQKYYHFNSFEKKLKQTFRQLPNNRRLVYCDNEEYKTIENEQDWQEFYNKSKEIVNLHIFDKNEKEMISIQEGMTNLIHILFKNIMKEDEYMNWKEINEFLHDTDIQTKSYSFIETIENKISQHQFSEKETQIEYQMEFIKDITFVHSNCKIKQNEKHLKIWKVRNNGNVQWPNDCYVGYWKGNTLFPLKSSFIIPQIIRGNVIQLSYEFEIQEKGNCLIQCRLFTKDNIPFGDILWIQCEVI